MNSMKHGFESVYVLKASTSIVKADPSRMS